MQQPGGIEDRLKVMATAVLENFFNPLRALMQS